MSEQDQDLSGLPRASLVRSQRRSWWFFIGVAQLVGASFFAAALLSSTSGEGVLVAFVVALGYATLYAASASVSLLIVWRSARTHDVGRLRMAVTAASCGAPVPIIAASAVGMVFVETVSYVVMGIVLASAVFGLIAQPPRRRLGL